MAFVKTFLKYTPHEIYNGLGEFSEPPSLGEMIDHSADIRAALAQLGFFEIQGTVVKAYPVADYVQPMRERTITILVVRDKDDIYCGTWRLVVSVLGAFVKKID